MFGAGCEILSLEEEHFQEKLTASINSMWSAAKDLRVPLLDSAAKQIEWGNAAYQKLFEWVEHRGRYSKSRFHTM
jgi:hypothetical protein